MLDIGYIARVFHLMIAAVRLKILLQQRMHGLFRICTYKHLLLSHAPHPPDEIFGRNISIVFLIEFVYNMSRSNRPLKLFGELDPDS